MSVNQLIQKIVHQQIRKVLIHKGKVMMVKVFKIQIVTQIMIICNHKSKSKKEQVMLLIFHFKMKQEKEELNQNLIRFLIQKDF